MSGLNSATRDAMRRLPLFVVSIAFLAGVAALYGTITARTDSVHVYLLDDPYIHMAVAKNLAQHGVWGPTRYAPGFASSSPLWVLLLAGSYLVVGVRDLIPFAFNVIFGLGIVALLFR